jgi:hypothetical protein
MTDFILPISIVMSTISFTLIVRWYLMPAVRDLPRAAALAPLLLFHSFRYVGMAFLIPGVTS